MVCKLSKNTEWVRVGKFRNFYIRFLALWQMNLGLKVNQVKLASGGRLQKERIEFLCLQSKVN